MARFATVQALADRGGGVAAVERDLVDEQMRQGVQQHESRRWGCAVGLEAASGPPVAGGLLQALVPVALSVVALPLLDSGLGKGDEDPFAADFSRGQPRLGVLPDGRDPGRVSFVGAVDAGEPAQGLHFAQTVDSDGMPEGHVEPAGDIQRSDFEVV